MQKTRKSTFDAEASRLQREEADRLARQSQLAAMQKTRKSTFDAEASRLQREEADRLARQSQLAAMFSASLPPLDEYVDLPGLLAEKKMRESFSTEDSARWFVRRHRDALAACGAVIIIAGRMRYHPERFKQAAVVIGQRAAA